jgi:hypothetical protein
VFIPLKEYSGTFSPKLSLPRELISQSTHRDFFIPGIFRDILIWEEDIFFQEGQ